MKVLFITLFIIIADQVSKIWIKGISIPALGINIQGMHYHQSINVIGDFFKFTYVENPGMAFGIQIGGKLFLSIFTIVATVLLIYYIYKNRNESLYFRFALALILGGAIGNLIDRIFYGKIYGYAPLLYGYVVDFLHVDTPTFTILGKTFHSFPIFNIADVAVFIGFAMILFGFNKIPKTSEKSEENKPEENKNLENTFLL
jgi:signal peptidase II